MILRATYNLLCTATICLGLVFVMGCDSGVMPAGSWEYLEIGRFKSPDSLVDAVLIEGGGGATTSTIQYVCLLPQAAEQKPQTEKQRCLLRIM